MENLPELIQRMLEPDFYPHKVAKPIRMIQTHSSYVLLTGCFAYKIKKKVNFGFLDFSTLEKRFHFSSEALRLNKRTAEEIHIDVVPITQEQDGKYLLEGVGDPIEYALKMREFKNEHILGYMLENNKVTESNVKELGNTIARYHLNAETNNDIKKYGSVSNIRASVDENYEQTQQYVGRLQSIKQLEETRAFTDRFFEENVDLFTARMKRNFIRECHGDLHLDNIVMWKNKLVPFDCIEFNKEFRFVDVIYDVAFTLMDLDAKGRPDLANCFLNAYIKETGDLEGLHLLSLYMSRHAYVRAKCLCFSLDDKSLDKDLKKLNSELAANYFKLAWEYTKPKQGGVFLICERPSSTAEAEEKVYVGAYLARKLSAIYICERTLQNYLKADIYTDDSIMGQTSSKYDTAAQIGIELAKKGFIVVVDINKTIVQLKPLTKQAEEAKILFRVI